MSRVFERYLSTLTETGIVASTGSAPTMGTTEYDRAASGNCDGAEAVEVSLNVTSGPASDAAGAVWVQKHDGTGYGKVKHGLVVALANGDTRVPVGRIYGLAGKFKLGLKTDVAFTSDLIVRPLYHGDA